MTNIYAFRATDPKELLSQFEIVGPDNRKHLKEISAGAAITIAAWGNHGEVRGDIVIHSLYRAHYLTMTKRKQPGHPLYLKKDLKPQPY